MRRSKTIIARSRTYPLAIEVARAVRFTVGGLGTFDFPAGCYVYTGSPKRNLHARVALHLSRGKRLRWHIDYLLAARGVCLSGVRYFDASECVVHAATRGAPHTARTAVRTSACRTV